MTSERFIPRTTVYRGIEMRSRLEAGFAAWLDEWELGWHYEPHAFGNQIGQYLPDFRLDAVRSSWNNWEPRTAYAEIKPAIFGDRDEDEYERLMRSMAIIWDSEPDALLLLVQPPRSNAVSEWADLGFLNPKLSPTRDPAFPWPQNVVWARGPDGTIGLAAPLAARRGPWANEYWRARP
jgi:hypothetical protein